MSLNYPGFDLRTLFSSCLNLAKGEADLLGVKGEDGKVGRGEEGINGGREGRWGRKEGRQEGSWR